MPGLAHITVAVVDSGVDPGHPAVGPLLPGVRVDRSGVSSSGADSSDPVGHGTATAALVRRFAPGARLLPIKLCPHEGALRPEELAAGIDAAVSLGADVINVGAGCAGAAGSDLVVAACRRALEAGAVVVAAEANDGAVTVPAALDTVIAAASDPGLGGRRALRVDPHDRRRILAYGGYQRVAWIGPPQVFLEGNSFAAPRVSAAVARLLALGVPRDRPALLAALAREASEASPVAAVRSSPDAGIGASVPARAPDFIRRAAVFPLSKEIASLVRFRHLLPFELAGVADVVARGHVGRDAGEVLGLDPVGLTVTSRLEEALERADTLVLGYTDRLGALERRALGQELARRALELGRNVYAFEALEAPGGPLAEEAARRGLRLVSPGVTAADLAALRATAPREGADWSRTPILGVFGTSPAQGKFTLQLRLREALRGLGLAVAQVGTEHQAALLGMEDCFPMGYASGVELPIADWREYFDLRYRMLARARPDLIVVGAQSGVVPYSLHHPPHGPLTLPSVALLTAVRADAFVLVVNHHDDPSFVADTLDALRIFGKARAVMLALSDRRRQARAVLGRTVVTVEPTSPAEQRRAVEALEDRFGLPTITIVDPADAPKMLDAVLGAFGAQRPGGTRP